MNDSIRDGLRDRLKETVDEAEWSWLIPHVKRDAVILVSSEIDLLNAAETVARDHKAQVQEWLSRGTLIKPTGEQIQNWGKTPTKKFLTVVVEPYVLAQELILN